MVTKVLAVGAIALLAYGIYRISYDYRRRREHDQEQGEHEALLDEEEGDRDSKRVWFNQLEVDHLNQPQLDDGRGQEWVTPVSSFPVARDRELPAPPASALPRVKRVDSDSDRDKGEAIHLEVTSGLSVGLRFSLSVVQGALNTITIGRMPQNDLTLNDPEVSGKHAVVSWHSKSGTWQITDIGSLNGTQVNRQSIHVQHRIKGQPQSLSDGDIITLGSSSDMLVKVTTGHTSLHTTAIAAPFGVGVSSDPMKPKKGGQLLPMEDVPFCEWPLAGLKEFGIFCIFDGHCGRKAADDASRILPSKVAELLGDPLTRSSVLEKRDVSNVLLDAFSFTEASLPYEDQGCTATAMLIWRDASGGGLLAQCANVGDSACVFSVGGKLVPMTEDHRVSSANERARLADTGHAVPESANRLCGMNVARVLGDKFLKDQNVGLSAEPYISPVLSIDFEGNVMAVMASDGLWDVLTAKKAIQIALDTSKAFLSSKDLHRTPAEAMAEALVHKARVARATDNTTVLVLDFKQYGHMMQFDTLRAPSIAEGRETG